MKFYPIIPILLLSFMLVVSCSSEKSKHNEEQIVISSRDDSHEKNDSLLNSITGNVTMKQISSFPNKVILTGLSEHRLVTIYKTKQSSNSENNSNSSRYSDYDENSNEMYEHYMPGIDILVGYNLLNIAHYDFATEKGNFLFSRPVLIKTLYYPSFIQDSIGKEPINRNYYLVSVYDEDTNRDSLINKKDLRRFYFINTTTSAKTQLIPPDYSAIHSQYDSKNDYMYVFAKHDENKNGTQDKSEAINVFWINLKAPQKAKLLY